MTSSKTQLPFEYYSLNFCKPSKVEYQSENLGEVLRGDRIVNTLYNVNVSIAHKYLVIIFEKFVSDEHTFKLYGSM